MVIRISSFCRNSLLFLLTSSALNVVLSHIYVENIIDYLFHWLNTTASFPFSCVEKLQGPYKSLLLRFVFYAKMFG